MDGEDTVREQEAIKYIVGGMKPLLAMRKAGIKYTSSSKRGRKLRLKAAECKSKQDHQK